MNIQHIGNLEILKNNKLALFCSRKCPPDIIVKSLDLAIEIRKAGITVIGGFQTIVEKEFLNVLLKGKQNIIWCPARNIENYNYSLKFKKAVKNDRCLILSNFPQEDDRISKKRGIERNYFVAEQANAILILYAAPDSNTEKLAISYRNSEKKLFTIESESNEYILNLGYKPYHITSF
ncbi:MAG: hypothetical protein H8E11_02265 [Candidatus Cloacimonetes bacterium]|nr:hypothetical protein [Candidatus Cloacimonadota bacterium]